MEGNLTLLNLMLTREAAIGDSATERKKIKTTKLRRSSDVMQIKVVFIEVIKAKEGVRESVIHKQIDVFKSL